MPECVTLEGEGAVATITLDRPDRRNALTLELIRDLRRALDLVAEDRSLRVAVISATGTVFCAGHDLDEMREMDESGLRGLFGACADLMTAIHELPQMVIAKVQGPAVAGGCHLVATCDLAVASERASFAVPGLRLGLTGITALVEVARAAGRKRALQLLVTGETIDAVTATTWGLVNEAVPHDELDDATARLAANIASASGSVIENAKRDLFENLDLPLGRAYAHAAPAMAASAAAPPGREGVAAFLERRAPTWLG